MAPVGRAAGGSPDLMDSVDSWLAGPSLWLRLTIELPRHVWVVLSFAV